MFKRHLFYQPVKLLYTGFILLFSVNIRIVKINRNIEILTQILQSIAAARCTAGVEKEGRNPALFSKLFYFFI